MRYWFLKMRKEMKMKQIEMAEFLEVSQQQVSNIENGKPISRPMAKRIAKRLSIDSEKFFKEYDN